MLRQSHWIDGVGVLETTECEYLPWGYSVGDMPRAIDAPCSRLRGPAGGLLADWFES